MNEYALHPSRGFWGSGLSLQSGLSQTIDEVCVTQMGLTVGGSVTVAHEGLLSAAHSAEMPF